MKKKEVIGDEINFVEIKLNTTRANEHTLRSVNSLYKLDDMLFDVIPKLFFCYKVTKDDIFIVVPKEFKDRVRRVIIGVLFIDLIGYRNLLEGYI